MGSDARDPNVEVNLMMIDVAKKLKDFIMLFDGKIKPFDQIDKLFDELFHDSSAHGIDGKFHNKEQSRRVAKWIYANKTVVNIYEFTIVGENQVELELNLRNSKIDVVSHSFVDVQDGKVVKTKTLQDSRDLYIVMKSYVVQVMKKYYPCSSRRDWTINNNSRQIESDMEG